MMWFNRCIKTDFVATLLKIARLNNERTLCALFCIRVRFDLNFSYIFFCFSVFEVFFFSSILSSVKRLFITSKFPGNLFILWKSFNEPTTMLWFVSFDFFLILSELLSSPYDKWQPTLIALQFGNVICLSIEPELLTTIFKN